MYTSNTARLAIEEFGVEISEEGSKEFRVVVMDDGSTSPPVVVTRLEFDGSCYRQEPCTLHEAGHEATQWAGAARSWVLLPKTAGAARDNCLAAINAGGFTFPE
jgi:hypothetical protein